MSIIGLVGPYSTGMRQTAYSCCPDGYTIVEIPTPQQYHLLQEVDYIILRTSTFGQEELRQSPKLKMIAKYAVGCECIDLPAAGSRNIPVVNCLGINTQAVAEMTILQILALYRNLLPLSRKLRKGEWAKDEYLHLSHQLSGKTLGLIGFGNIGRRVAELAQAFGAKVIYYDIFPLDQPTEQRLGVRRVSLEELAGTADIVSIHAPGGEGTRRLIDAEFLKRMKHTAILVNNSRGPAVDEAALLEALRSGQILGAAMDVFDPEPPGDSPLLQLDNVVPTPHVAGSTSNIGEQMIQRCLSNIHRFAIGASMPAPSVANLELLADRSIITLE